VRVAALGPIDLHRIGQHHSQFPPGAVDAMEQLDEGEEVGVLDLRDAAGQDAVADRRQREPVGAAPRPARRSARCRPWWRPPWPGARLQERNVDPCATSKNVSVQASTLPPCGVARAIARSLRARKFWGGSTSRRCLAVGSSKSGSGSYELC